MTLHSRIKRINEEVRDALADIIMREVKDPRLAHGMVTVSNVAVSKDLHFAQVWVSIFGSEAEQQTAIEGLNHSSKFIKHALGQRVVLKNIPELAFKLDTSFAYADKINRMLKELDTPKQS
ncbi:MAG: 30S ribosome-binding factor RbfA [Candidatus Sumerlaeota bacterium]|nr:30S ribosome-binding factor RbfA [Candidatus Sumerlaeota bacterium]